MTAVAGAKDRDSGWVLAEVIEDTTRETLHEFINENVERESNVYTDEALAYRDLEGYKHLHRYVSEFVGRNNVRQFGTLIQMMFIMHNMVGTHLP